MKCIDLRRENLRESNLSLIFYKCAPSLSQKDSKSKWFSKLSKTRFAKNALDKILSRTFLLIRQSLKMEKVVLEFFTTQPLIVGLGEASPYETGITLDFLTGLPIIPGSALKGITRRAAIMIYGAEYWDKFSSNFQEKFKCQPEIKQFNGLKYIDLLPYGEEFAFVADQIENFFVPGTFTEIFGTQDQKGKVIFMDAYPIDWPDGKLFRLDVMNPHYGPYYENPSKNPPADWYNPIPVFYLTVNVGVKYRFILAGKDNGLLKIAENWLKFALTEIGIGAKGNQGYGAFEEVRNANQNRT